MDAPDNLLQININYPLRPYTKVVKFIKQLERRFVWLIRYYDNHGIYQLYSTEFIDELLKVLCGLDPKRLLEVHAGNGLLNYYLSQHIPISAIDDYSSPILEHGKYYHVEKLDTFDSVTTYEPDICISCWAPIDFPIHNVLHHSSVRYLIYIGEHKHYGATASPELFEYPYLAIKSATEYALCRSDRNFNQDEPVLHSGVYVFVHPKNIDLLRKIRCSENDKFY